jgi:hypothetical protein
MMEAEQKQCRTCNHWKDAAKEYTWRGGYPYHDCNLCRAEAMKERYHSDAAYREARRKSMRESMARRRAAERGGE